MFSELIMKNLSTPFQLNDAIKSRDCWDSQSLSRGISLDVFDSPPSLAGVVRVCLNS